MNELNTQDLLLKLLEQNNRLIEQNNALIQINTEQSAQLSEVLSMFEDSDEVASRSNSLDG